MSRGYLIYAEGNEYITKPKKITSSSGVFTGFLNRTIERAPLIPKETKKLFAIIFVITKDIGGNNK